MLCQNIFFLHFLMPYLVFVQGFFFWLIILLNVISLTSLNRANHNDNLQVLKLY